jgi:uncharacterized protein (TIGR02147 family)
MEYNRYPHSEKMAPQILQYNSIAQYFEDYLTYRKQLNEKFSFEILAAEIGFKSRSYIHMLIHGKKKISSKFVDSFSQYLKLNQKESSHLTALCLYYNSKNNALKSIFGDKILENLDDPKNIVDIQNHEKFLSSEHAPTIRLLLAFKDFKGTVENLKSVLNIDQNQLIDTLQLLKELELIHWSETDCGWKASTKSFKALGPSQNTALKKYHLNSLKEAESNLIDNEDMSKFKSILFSMDKHNFPQFTEEVDSFMRKMKLKYESAQLSQKHVFKMNVQAYPLTKKYE